MKTKHVSGVFEQILLHGQCKAALSPIEILMKPATMDSALEEPNGVQCFAEKNKHMKQRVEELLLRPFLKENKPEKIIGVFDVAGTLLFLVKYKNSEADFVPASVANENWPAMVIQFYENNIEWN